MKFVMKNVFDQQVYEPVHHTFTKAAYHSLIESGIEEDLLKEYKDLTFDNSLKLSSTLRKTNKFTHKERVTILDRTRLVKCRISDRISQLNTDLLSEEQIATVKKFIGTVFLHKWQLVEALSTMSPSWQYKPDNLINRSYNEELRSKYDYLDNFFKND